MSKFLVRLDSTLPIHLYITNPDSQTILRSKGGEGGGGGGGGGEGLQQLKKQTQAEDKRS